MSRMDNAQSEYLFHQGTNYHAYDYPRYMGKNEAKKRDGFV